MSPFHGPQADSLSHSPGTLRGNANWTFHTIFCCGAKMFPNPFKVSEGASLLTMKGKENFIG
jgi:hypothetical protein